MIKVIFVCFFPGIVLYSDRPNMATIKRYINKSKGDQRTVWFITALLVIAGFPSLKNFAVFVLMKLYELFVQHAIGDNHCCRQNVKIY